MWNTSTVFSHFCLLLIFDFCQYKAVLLLCGKRHIGLFPDPQIPFTKLVIAFLIFKRWFSLMLIAK